MIKKEWLQLRTCAIKYIDGIELSASDVQLCGIESIEGKRSGQ